ncbi:MULTISPECIES: flagellar hook assembly protein FlgD [Paraclostridium]|nr:MULTISPECIES: flagellar hook capping FlgD N-terminal domain-containing protein [Paraclostridium]MBZ6004993.1 flagellar biosynthesis protein FlgD [Paraclostridium bifermentans]MCU9808019.1 flagellar biosynthesis protein FlgD [Paraclostridium sp. AKS46]MDU0298524.1 flagellar hook capping FlgD N-terminal domain-containing protein [Paraclostridium sp. MRS3W1]MDV8108832.1 flagellar hook capping FlgD N-terminal domain-containing protein [Bacillus sp. BAU-SS-2023]
MNNFMKLNTQQASTKSSTGTKTVANTKSSGKTDNGTPIVMPGEETNKDLFLKLLVAQMSNQDPLNPQDPTQYVTQLAQFSSLEQMQNLNEGMEYLVGLTNGVLVNSAMSTASALIGKRIEAYAPKEDDTEETNNVVKEDEKPDDKKTITGVVEGIKIKDGIVYMEVRVDESGELKSIEYGSLIKASENKDSVESNTNKKGE